MLALSRRLTSTGDGTPAPAPTAHRPAPHGHQIPRMGLRAVASGFCWWPRSPLHGDSPGVCGVCCAGRTTHPPGKWVSSPGRPHFITEEWGAVRFLETGACSLPGHATPSSSLSRSWSVGGSGGLGSLERSRRSSFDKSLSGKSLRSLSRLDLDLARRGFPPC